MRSLFWLILKRGRLPTGKLRRKPENSFESYVFLDARLRTSETVVIREQLLWY
jgi:hypothetical protein